MYFAILVYFDFGYVCHDPGGSVDTYSDKACRLAEWSKASCISLTPSDVGSNPTKVFIPYSQIYF